MKVNVTNVTVIEDNYHIFITSFNKHKTVSEIINLFADNASSNGIIPSNHTVTNLVVLKNGYSKYTITSTDNKGNMAFVIDVVCAYIEVEPQP